ncbi:hypothetical protein [Polaromonas sp.]|uniref:hypothetical protein n=1 Tax=Polaromonas sp. TaxID=1869339 RepID=UPI003BB4D87C
MPLPIRNGLDVQQTWSIFKAWLLQLYDHTAVVVENVEAGAAAVLAIHDRHYGESATDPVTRPSGAAMQVGDEYFNTTSNLLFRFNGATWQASDINTANLAAPGGADLVGWQSFPGKGTTLAKVRTVNKKLSDHLHLFDIVTSTSEQNAIRNGGSSLDLSGTINDAINHLADFTNGGSLKLPAGFLYANELVLQPKVHLIGDESPIFNESGDVLSSAVIYQLPGATGAVLRNSTDSGWIRNPTSEVDGLPQRYSQASIRKLSLHLNGNNDLRCIPLRIERAWGFQMEKCYLKTSNGGWSAQFLDCNTLRLNDSVTVGTMFWDSVADSQMWAMQMGGAGGSKTWPVLWLSDIGCWKNQLVNLMPYNNTVNAGAPAWVFSASGAILATTTSHILYDEIPVVVTTTGVLPTGLSEGVTYFVKRLDATGLSLATSRKNARDGVVIATTDAGSGTHTLQIGLSANVLLNSRANRNQFGIIRADQAYGSAVHLDNAFNNTFENLHAAEGGKGNAIGQAAVRLTNGSYGNNFVGGLLDGETIGTSHQIYGVVEDDSSCGRNTFGSAFDSKNHVNANYIGGSNHSGELHSMWLGSDRFEVQSGTPAVANIGGNRRNAWMFDAASEEIISTELVMPAGWQRVAFKLFWVNAGAGAGDAVWNVSVADFGVGDTVNVVDFAASADIASTANTQDRLVTLMAFVSTGFRPEPGKVLFIRIKRVAAAAADTLANDAGLIGVQLQRIPD